MIPEVFIENGRETAQRLCELFSAEHIRAAVKDNDGAPKTGVDVLFSCISGGEAVLTVQLTDGGFKCGEMIFASEEELSEHLISELSAMDKCWLKYARLASGGERCENKVSVFIDGRELPLLPFVQNILRAVNMGVLSTLKDTEPDKASEVIIRIS